MNALVFLALVLAQSPDSKALAESRKKVSEARLSLADMRAVSSKLLANLEELQTQIIAKSKELDDSLAALHKTESELNAYLLSEEMRILEIRRLLVGNGAKAPIKLKANPKGKDIYGDGLETSALKLPITTNGKSLKAPIIKPFDADAYKPRGTPNDIGNVEKADGSVVRWWTYSERPKKLFLFSGELLLGAWDREAKTYRRAVNGSVINEPLPMPPVLLPKD